MVFTNQRQTYDVQVSKELISNTNASLPFGFKASYTETYTDTAGQSLSSTVNLEDFVIVSGSSRVLEDIPAGVALTITEDTDANDNYDTYIKLDNNPETTGKSTATFTVGSDPAVAGKHTVDYRNELKSYPVTFILVDQDGNTTINGMFALASSVGSLGSELYASATSTTPPPGEFYTSDKFWADTYTLSQTTVHTGYIGLNEPVTITVNGEGIKSNNENVIVTGDPTNGYVITVKNYATKKVTVKKVLNDPLLSSTRTFGFDYSYTPEGATTPVTGTFTLAPWANDPDGATYELVVPINAAVTVTEKTSGTYSGIPDTYDTSVVCKELKEPEIVQEQNGSTYTIRGVVENDNLLTFTNTRKTVHITVRKLVDDTTDTTAFTFTALLMNGAYPINAYHLYDNNTGQGKDLITNNEGNSTFVLRHGEEQTLTVPIGAKLEVTETVPTGYTSSAVMVDIGGNPVADDDPVGEKFKLNTITKGGTITFTNSRAAPVAPTGFTSVTRPFTRMLFAGLVLFATMAIPVYNRRKRREEGGDADD